MLLIALILIGVYGYQRYALTKGNLERARDHIRSAETELRVLEAKPTEFNLAHFQGILGQLGEARHEVGDILSEAKSIDFLLRTASALPLIGNNAQAASHLIRIADSGLQGWDAANESVQALLATFSEPGGQHGTERLLRTVEAARPGLGKVALAVKAAQDEYGSIPQDGLLPALGSLIDSIGKQLSAISQAVAAGEEGSNAALHILGADGDYTFLVLVQDTGEIRPTGGFIGNYGIIKLSQGRIVEQKFGDTYSLDWPYYYSGKSSSPTAMFARYLPESTFWALRDSNTSPDFPTSAQQAARFAIEEGAADHVDGVIAITPTLARRILQVIGPVNVPGFDEVVNDQNFEEQIRYHEYHGPTEEVKQRIGNASASDRKLFTSLLINALIEKVNTLDINSTFALIPALRDAVREKYLLVYFEDPQLQRLGERYDLGGEMKPTIDDYLWIVDMNLSASKDNLYIQQTAQYTTTVAPDGSAISELEITYDYRRTGDLYLFTIKRGYYGDYLRIYVPEGSVLLGSDGSDESVRSFEEHGKTVFETFLKIYPGTTRIVKLRYRRPSTSQPTAVHEYQLLVQKQPATNTQSLDVNVILPKGSVVTTTQNLVEHHGVLQYRGPLGGDSNLKGSFELP